MRLARRREADHPLDALTIYDRDVGRHIGRKGRPAYRAVVRQLEHIHILATCAGQSEVFDTTLERIRSDHRRQTWDSPRPVPSVSTMITLQCAA